MHGTVMKINSDGTAIDWQYNYGTAQTVCKAVMWLPNAADPVNNAGLVFFLGKT